MVFISIQEVVYTQRFEIALGYFNYLLQELYYMKKKGKKKKKICLPLTLSRSGEMFFKIWAVSISSPQNLVGLHAVPVLYIYTECECVSKLLAWP